MMSSKIGVIKILRDHLETLTDGNKKTISWIDVGTFYIVPIVCGFVFYALVEKVDEKVAERLDTIIVSAFAIFAALLFNLQVLILNAAKPAKSGSGLSREATAEDTTWYKRRLERTAFLFEVFSNLSYAIAVAILLVVSTMLFIFVGWDQSPVAKAFQLGGVLHFALTLLMILKRMHIVLGADFPK